VDDAGFCSQQPFFGRLDESCAPVAPVTAASGTTHPATETTGRRTRLPACTSSLKFGPVTAEAGCFHNGKNGTWLVDGRVRIGGLDIVGSLTLDPNPGSLSVSAQGKVEVQLATPAGPLTLYHGALDWSFRAPLYRQLSFKVGGLPTSGGVAMIELAPPDSVKIQISVQLPPAFGGITGDVTLVASQASGLQLDALKVTAPDFSLGPLRARGLVLSYDSKADRWTGKATLTFDTAKPPLARAACGVRKLGFACKPSNLKFLTGAPIEFTHPTRCGHRRRMRSPSGSSAPSAPNASTGC
jgi:hypothetical protein